MLCRRVIHVRDLRVDFTNMWIEFYDHMQADYTLNPRYHEKKILLALLNKAVSVHEEITLMEDIAPSRKHISTRKSASDRQDKDSQDTHSRSASQ